MAVLLQRLDGALRLLDAEIIFVDDSDDDTRQQILRLGATSGCPVRVVNRPPGQRVGGLSGAVVVGLRTAQASWAVVMDADLQHPPEVVPRLLDAAGPDVDLVVATRYADEGEPAGLDGPVRRLVSLTCTVLARTLFSRRLRDISDAMSGFWGCVPRLSRWTRCASLPWCGCTARRSAGCSRPVTCRPARRSTGWRRGRCPR